MKIYQIANSHCRDEKEELSLAEEKVKELEEKPANAEDEKDKKDLAEKKAAYINRKEEVVRRQLARQKPAVRTHVVKAGDTLTTLAEKYYGDPKMYMILYEANKETIGDDPDMIKIGMELKVPDEE